MSCNDRKARPVDRFPLHMQQAIRLIAAVVVRMAEKAKPEGGKG